MSAFSFKGNIYVSCTFKKDGKTQDDDSSPASLVEVRIGEIGTTGGDFGGGL